MACSLTLKLVWVHSENILEVKTYILHHLPILIYNPQTSKAVESGNSDPSITSLYFDNPQFLLYNDKVAGDTGASSLRLRWFGHLSNKTEILFEKKTVQENGDSEEIRFPIKDKYVLPFIKGEYKLEKSIEKLQSRQRNDDHEIARLEQSVEEIQKFVKDKEVQPVLRANYTRTAFQIPGDDRVRISLDTNVVFIREDSLSKNKPYRSSEEWHRRDVDDAEMEYPFSSLKEEEISRFPYALLEIKIRNQSSKRITEWATDLMSSHLVKEAPRFSKFVHGVAELFEDLVNTFPFWLSDLETDIRKDPTDAFEEEQEKKAKEAEEEQVVGSFLGGKSKAPFTPLIGSPAGKSVAIAAGSTPAADISSETEDDGLDHEARVPTESGRTGLRSFLPSLSNSRYARAHRRTSVHLPPGVREPGPLLKDAGPVRVEPKVWLANQRTFIKWQHISILLGTLSLALYNAAGPAQDLARGLAVAYTLVALFAGAWGWWQYTVRSRMIRQRSGKDFDNVVGPVIICACLAVGLCLNLGLQVRRHSPPPLLASAASTANDSLVPIYIERSCSSCKRVVSSHTDRRRAATAWRAAGSPPANVNVPAALGLWTDAHMAIHRLLCASYPDT